MQAETRISYRDLGRGPAIVMLHDVMLTPDCWHRQIPPLLDAGFRVILPDLASCPGDGRIESYTNEIITLLNRLGLGRVVVCGMGMGGAILFDLVERFPQRVVGACFVATRPVTDDIQEKARRGELIADLLQQDGWWVREELVKMLLIGRERQLQDCDRLAVQQMIHEYPRQALIDGQKALAGRKDYSRLLHSMVLPTLVIGGEHNNICHPAHTRVMAEKLPNCFQAVNLDSGHLVPLEQANAFNERLLEFVRKILPFRSPGDHSLPRQAA